MTRIEAIKDEVARGATFHAHKMLIVLQDGIKAKDAAFRAWGEGETGFDRRWTEFTEAHGA